MNQSKKESHNLVDSELKLHPIKRFLIFSSGANFNILKYCPEEGNKFASIGATILLTAILACLSGGYAFHFVFESTLLSILFGVFWGIVIYNLDRYIVMSLRKGNSEKISTIIKEPDPTTKKSMISDKISSSGNTLLMALPRIVIAIIIALTVSKPIELRLFNKRIVKELGNIEKNDISEFETKFKNEIKSINEQINSLNQKESKEKEDVYSNNPVYQNKLSRSNKIDTELKSIDKLIKTNEGIIKQNTRLKTGYRNVTRYYSDGTPYNSRESYKYWDKNQTARAKDAENKELRKRKSELFSEQNEIKNELSGIEKEFKDAISKISENYNASRKPLLDQIENKNNSYPTDLANWKNKVKGSTDLLARLEALGNITSEKDTDGSRNSAYWSSLLITLLFISLETAPVIVKLLTKRGPYDELLDRIEYEYFIQQQEAISKMNSKVNTILEKIKESSKLEGQMFLDVEKQKLDAELKANEEILDDISKKQAHLAKLSIEQWYKEELEKYKNGNSNTNA